jgi:putative ABC transport system permease protein
MHRILWREWFGNKLYPLLFSLCLTISLGAFLTLDALQQSVNDYVNDNQKQIVGGDIIITDNQPWSEDILSEINQLNSEDVVFDYQFNAIAYTTDESILTRIKAVTPTYPLYGELILSGNTQPWQPGSVLVEQQILSSLNVSIGDSIKIGEADFIIHDEIITEPDRPLTAFGFGSRVIMHDTDLKKTQLLGKKSRVNYRIEIRSEILEKPLLFDTITSIIKLDPQAKTSVKTAEESNTSLSNLSQNFLVFLKLLVIAVILLSGIGVMSIVSAFVAKQRNTNAIRSAMGEPSQSIINSYRLLFTLMALLSVALAWLMSLLVLHLGKDVFSAILPNNINLAIDLFSVFKAIVIALLLTGLMTYFTLNSIRKIKPVAVLHKHQLKQKLSKKPWLWILFTCVSAFLLIYSELSNFMQSLQIFVGIIVIWVVFSLLSKLLLRSIKWLLNKKFITQWMVVLALQNIFRKDNHSSLFITVLSLTTMILGTIKILDHSIQQQLISTYPEDAPNLFFLDIQTEQQTTLDTLVGESLTYYPVVRARLDSVNGVSTDVLKDRLGRYDNISRIFNLSYATSLLPTEELLSSVKKDQLFSELESDENDYQAMSILESFADFLQVDLGDEVIFNIQGIKIKTKITSIRKRLKRGPSPFFYFIFPPEVLQNAPQIRFATAKVSDDRRIKIQTSVAKALPGITTLDGGSIAKKLKEFTDQLKQMVEIFTALSLFAGLLIFITSLVSTSQDRLKESFYYRMMGMLGRDLLKLTTIEFLALGLFAFNLGVLIAAVISALITKYWFALSFIFPWQVFLIALSVLLLILLSISFIYTHHVKKTKVTTFLRYE